MEEIHLFPIVLFEDMLEVPEDLILEITNRKEDESKIAPDSWFGGVKTSFVNQDNIIGKYKEQKIIIDKSVKILREHPAYNSFGENFKVNYEFWWNYYEKGTHQDYHDHSYNVLSGIWFLKDSKTPVIFTNRGDKVRVYPKRGVLLIFPSWLPHYVESSVDERITISFNFDCTKL